MKDGTIQQTGTPDEIYERPANLFVASFLGSPTINLLEGALETESGATVFRRGALTIPLPSLQRGAREITLGLRPEDVGPPGEGPQLHGVVDTAMPSGADQFLGVLVEGAMLFLRVSKDMRVGVGEPVSFSLNPERLHVFDRATGLSLRGAA